MKLTLIAAFTVILLIPTFAYAQIGSSIGASDEISTTVTREDIPVPENMEEMVEDIYSKINNEEFGLEEIKNEVRNIEDNVEFSVEQNTEFQIQNDINVNFTYVGIGISVAGVAISIIIAIVANRISNRQNEILTEIDEKAEGIREQLDKLVTDSKEREYENTMKTKPTDEPTSKPTDSKYDEKAKKCMDMLEDKRWTWRSDVILMRKSGLNKKDFEYFVDNTKGVVRSKVPDMYGNKLYSLESKLKK